MQNKLLLMGMAWLPWSLVSAAACGGGGGGGGFDPVSCLADAACPYALVSAHRGMCGDEPENTLAAYLGCQALGVPMVEVDPRQTADGVWVLMHDDDVTRTTDGETRFPGKTRVDQLTAAEFAQLVINDSRCAGDPEANPERCHPALLEDLLRRTRPELLLDVDFKAGDATSLATLVKTLGAERRILFFDSNLESLRAYRAVVPGGLVMARVSSAAEAGQLVREVGPELELRWVHIDPGYLADAAREVAGSGARLYLNAWDYEVDLWLYAAELATDPEQRREMEEKAWTRLDELLQNGARGLGSERGAQISARLYPEDWWSSP
ncbi:MAG: glycerophosphodiester phosphodiesterase family protein [Myxococcales bacterium]|nr:glycerophosphodiester phosphodiesterase family protein [Myxococcales bacterium]